MKKLLLFLLSLSALPILFAESAAPQQNNKIVVGVSKVVPTTDYETRRYTGQVTSQAVVQVIPRVSGELLEVGFADGSAVKAGQMLYKLDPIQYEATVKNCEAKIAQIQAEINYAQHNYDRNLQLFEKDIASKDTLENTKSALEVLKANLQAAEADLIKAKDDLDNTIITAPIDGIVGPTNFTKGNYLTPNSGTLVTIIQAQPIRVRFSISTGDFLSMFKTIEEMKENAVVTIKLPSGITHSEEGVIEFINNEANSRTDAIQVYAQFPNAERKLVVGSTVAVSLAKKTGTPVPAVTPSAIMHDNDGSYVYVLSSDNKVEKRYVVLGSASADKQLVSSGLNPGETVITQGTHKVLPGSEVDPVEEN